MATFAEKLSGILEERGISQHLLGKRAALTQASISMLRSGTREPSWDTVQRIALALDVSCEDLKDVPGDDIPARPSGRPAGS